MSVENTQVIDPNPPAELVKVLEDAPDKVREDLLTTFSPFYLDAAPLLEKVDAIQVTDATQVTEMKQARELRLQIRRVRIDLENTRKEVKEDALAKTKAIDNVARSIRERCEAAERKLQDDEDFAAREEQRIKAERARERGTKVRELGADPSFYDLASMPDEAFDELVEALEAKKAKREEDDRRAAEERAKREEEARAERERLAKEAAEAAERERVEREARHKAERAAREARERAEALEAEQRAREAEEAEKARQARLKERREKRRAANAPDAEKIRGILASIHGMPFPARDSLKTEEGQKAWDAISDGIKRLEGMISKLADALESD